MKIIPKNDYVRSRIIIDKAELADILALFMKNKGHRIKNLAEFGIAAPGEDLIFEADVQKIETSDEGEKTIDKDQKVVDFLKKLNDFKHLLSAGEKACYARARNVLRAAYMTDSELMSMLLDMPVLELGKFRCYGKKGHNAIIKLIRLAGYKMEDYSFLKEWK